jgi:hypothetical protein
MTKPFFNFATFLITTLMPWFCSRLLIYSVLMAPSFYLALGQDSSRQSTEADSTRMTPPPPHTLPAGQRMLVRAPGNRHNPVKIQAILFDGKPVISRQAFEAPSDWLTRTEIVLRNDSSKRLVCVIVQVNFEGFPSDLNSFFVGIPPATSFKIQPDRSQPIFPEDSAISIAPGDTVRVPLSAHLGDMVSMHKHTGATPLDAQIVQIDATAAYFDDDTQWAGGAFYRPDKANPGHWIAITPTEFGPVNGGR